MNKTYIKRNFLKRKNKNKTRKIKGGEVRPGEVIQGDVIQPMMKPNNNPIKTNKNGLKLNGLSNKDYEEKKITEAMNVVKEAEANLANAKLNEVNAVKNVPIAQSAVKLAEIKLQEAKNILDVVSPKKEGLGLVVQSFLNFFKPKSSTQV
jgi:hypothetical protein